MYDIVYHPSHLIAFHTGLLIVCYTLLFNVGANFAFFALWRIVLTASSFMLYSSAISFIFNPVLYFRRSLLVFWV